MVMTISPARRNLGDFAVEAPAAVSASTFAVAISNTDSVCPALSKCAP